MDSAGPTTPQRPRARRVFAMPDMNHANLAWSPGDSGYGSAPSTPQRSTKIRAPLLSPASLASLDGCPDAPSRSEVNADNADNADEHHTNTGGLGGERSILLPPSSRHFHQTPSDSAYEDTALTRPRQGHFRSSLPSAFFALPSTLSPPSSQPRGSAATPASSCCPSPSPPFCPRLAVQTPRQPDRFVHPRDANGGTLSFSEKFRFTSTPKELTATEKFLRHSNASEDPFSSRRVPINHLAAYTDHNYAALQAEGVTIQTRSANSTSITEYRHEIGSLVNRRNDGPAWALGLNSPPTGAVDGGRGTLMQRGTSAPYYTSPFVHTAQQLDDRYHHRNRLAAALNVDIASRMLNCDPIGRARSSRSAAESGLKRRRRTRWDGTSWVRNGAAEPAHKNSMDNRCRPTRILSAPELRDDYYCSVIAYCSTSETIAVSLGDLLYSWTEKGGTQLLNGSHIQTSWITALAFSSAQGRQSILAFGRSNSLLGLLSIHEAGLSRIVIQESASITCLSWRPICTLRPTKNPYKDHDVLVSTEDLLVGDETGSVLYYVVEWPTSAEVEQDGWRGDMTLVARISVHYQQICGLAWSPDGMSLATGSNDNMCNCFHINNVLPPSFQHRDCKYVSDKSSGNQNRGDQGLFYYDSHLKAIMTNGRVIRERIPYGEHPVHRVGNGSQSWQWEHGAAVKAIAFCPWQEGLLATGGGSSDRCIHFFHTASGTALATIFVSSQVTSLIWSPTRREIAATFGFVHPGHPVRIAVYSWPDCRQVKSIRWEGNHRALFAVSCARGPNYWPPPELVQKRKDKGKGKMTDKKPRRGTVAGETREERKSPDDHILRDGCIAVASSDESIKFYELWPSECKSLLGGQGMLGGSDILEDLQGIQKEGDIIR